MNSPKTADEVDAGKACVLELKGSCNGDKATTCNPAGEDPCDCKGGSIEAIRAKVEQTKTEFAAAMEATAGESGCDPKCWKKTINDCARPSLCLDGYTEECTAPFQAAGGCATLDEMGVKQTEMDAQIAEEEAKIA